MRSTIACRISPLTVTVKPLRADTVYEETTTHRSRGDPCRTTVTLAMRPAETTPTTNTHQTHVTQTTLRRVANIRPKDKQAPPPTQNRNLKNTSGSPPDVAARPPQLDRRALSAIGTSACAADRRLRGHAEHALLPEFRGTSALPALAVVPLVHHALPFRPDAAPPQSRCVTSLEARAASSITSSRRRLRTLTSRRPATSLQRRYLSSQPHRRQRRLHPHLQTCTPASAHFS